MQQKEAEHQKEIESLKNKLASTAANTQMESIIQQRIEENTKRQSVEMEKLQQMLLNTISQQRASEAPSN